MDYHRVLYRRGGWCVLSSRLSSLFPTLIFKIATGLATVTPACGYISPSSALVFGVLGSSACYYAVQWKKYYHFDDALDVFAVHYVGGLVGLILVGVFAQASYSSLPNTESTAGAPRGWIDGKWDQVPIQLLCCFCTTIWSFIMTSAILLLMNIIPGLHLRIDAASEMMGLDLSEMGETAYGFLKVEPLLHEPIKAGTMPSPRRDNLDAAPSLSIKTNDEGFRHLDLNSSSAINMEHGGIQLRNLGASASGVQNGWLPNGNMAQ